MPTADPVRDQFFRPLERADRLIDVLFYVAGALSFVTLLIDEADRRPFNIAWIIFVALVTALFFASMVQRLYFFPRADVRRAADFFSKSFNVPLDFQTTDGYYNNNFSDPTKRIAAQLLENTHFSKALTRMMAWRMRAITAAYAALWLGCLLSRSATLPLVLAATQVFFSEQIVSRLWRMEWFRSECESIYHTMYGLFQAGNTSAPEFAARTLSEFTRYEKVKSNAALTLSSKVFNKHNATLTAEWEKIKRALKFES